MSVHHTCTAGRLPVTVLAACAPQELMQQGMYAAIPLHTLPATILSHCGHWQLTTVMQAHWQVIGGLLLQSQTSSTYATTCQLP